MVQGLELDDLEDPFQLKPSYDPIIKQIKCFGIDLFWQCQASIQTSVKELFILTSVPV